MSGKNVLKRCLPAGVKRRLWKLYEKNLIQRKLQGAAAVDVSYLGAAPISDISEHLNFLYFYLRTAKPTKILELGTRGGESTKVIERYCQEMNIVGNSFDLSPAPDWLMQSQNWNHYVGDDITLGKNLFKNRKLPDGLDFDELDFIFLDTSHEYHHTKEELEIYVPLLKDGVGAIAFHDTYLTNSPTLRLDGSVNHAWDNERGVTQAIEEYFGFQFDERSLQLQTICNGKFLFYHQPWCNGFSMIVPFNSNV